MQMPIRLFLIAGVAGCVTGSALAQWASQTITLRPGWNAVFLEVQPEPRETDAVFANLPVESVWFYNRRITGVQFIDDPTKLVPNQPDWLTWLAPSHPLAGKSKLSIIEGGKPYLVKLADDADPVPWTVHGTPVVRQPNWLADSVNLVGFPLVSGPMPTFRSFLGQAPALGTNPVYRLSTDGIWVRVISPDTTAMQRGEAFWVNTTGPCDFGGTLTVELERRTGLDFGRVLTEHTLRIRNTSTAPATFTLRQLLSEEPASTSFPALAGDVPLSYWRTNATARNGWTNLPTQLVAANVPPGEKWDCRLAIRRRDLPPFTPPPGVSNLLYESILEVSDGVTRVLVPVTAEVNVDQTGLWVGSVILNRVSQPAVDPVVATETGSTFQFRLMVHLDAQGQARLLQKVIQRWQEGTLKPAGDGSTNLVVDQPGRYVLLTDERLAANFKGATLRDGQEVDRRFSSAAFGFREPVLMTRTGVFGAPSSVCSATVVVGYNDPLNPFVHRFHPDHNNLNDRGDPLLVRDDGRGPYTSESYTITRQIELRFTPDDPDGLGLSGWGDTRLAGIYRETILGLHKDPLVVEGTFQLVKASSTGVLNQ